MKWKHDDLQEDLAAHLRRATDRMVWTNMQLGPVGSPRPDVYAVPKSYAKFMPIVYEIKISTADFQSDVRTGKWQSYLRFASAVTFAVPAGLVTKADLPPGCGLMVRGPDGWNTIKAPKLGVMENLPQDAWVKLLIDGIERQGQERRRKYAEEYNLIESLRGRLGNEVAQLLHARGRARDDYERETERLGQAEEDARKERQRILDESRAEANREASCIDQARQELAAALGLPPDAGLYEITGAAAAVRRRLEADAEVIRLRKLFDSIQHTLEKAATPLPTMVQPQ